MSASLHFGHLETNEAASLYLLSNGRGTTVGISDLGATLVLCRVADARGHLTDVLLGHSNASDYLGDSYCLGFVVGRNANRIANATFDFAGKTYHLAANDGPNNLHSGPYFWAHRIWKVLETGNSSITLELQSPSGDQGFPGSATAQVSYSLSEDDRLAVSYRVTPSEPTIVNLTNHAYWNLNGHASGGVLDHTLQIEAKAYTPLVDHLPTGQICPVEGTPYDFRRARTIGACLEELPDGYDDNFCLENNGGLAQAARLCGDASGIVMDVLTDAPGMQIYTDRTFSVPNGRDGHSYGAFAGIALETQYYPDAVNHENFPQPVFTPEHPFESTTVFVFGTNGALQA